mmetsp:Transcript_4861/g.6573  ORF Transcript_4861/g.6573 Transcript_4861/m.6573 type:complete len:101 (-) Transcript_4861:1361-1663(-)
MDTFIKSKQEDSPVNETNGTFEIVSGSESISVPYTLFVEYVIALQSIFGKSSVAQRFRASSSSSQDNVNEDGKDRLGILLKCDEDLVKYVLENGKLNGQV